MRSGDGLRDRRGPAHSPVRDVMRQRGNQYREHLAQTVPNVLNYEAELIIDGRTLKRPVNYGLVRIVPPKGTVFDPTRRLCVLKSSSVLFSRPNRLTSA